ncbi:MAG: STM4013/SEN3800 family hydrolase [Myxococcales bacterium]|nr:STM4013/SEN3800 family hydrolase [Myxococcales bacterium]
MDARGRVGSHDVVWVTLDTLRLDVARTCFAEGRLPTLAQHMPATGFEACHTPGSFTYAAHAAFFAGFLPTPAQPGRHERLFALAFEGSETTGPHTAVLDGASVPQGLAALGYRTVCIGGVGFFNQRTPLGRALPALFDVALWEPAFGVTDPRSTEHQVAAALQELPADPSQRVFLFLNVSALHQPNCTYVDGATADSPKTMAAALHYVDRSLQPLLSAMAARGPSLWVVCSDHGTAYGEDGYTGHRIGHPSVYTVPFTAFVVPS